MAAHRPPILQWQEIADNYNAGLIVGNGGSVAVDRGFSYGSLYQAAQLHGHIDGRVADVFRRFDTQDFELVLRRLWQATLVNQALELPDGPVEIAYVDVRDALIRTIRDTHVSYERALPHLIPIYRFMQRFRTIVSLNYDLIVYWAAMLGNQQLGTWFKDGFHGRRFNEDWRSYRVPLDAQETTMFFYPHGNLVLARTKTDSEVKIAARQYQDLLTSILDRWSTGRVVPLFVCEGTTQQKRHAIDSSSYLRTVLNEAMRELGEAIVIYGWGLGDQDAHILDALRASPCKRIAVSVHGGNYDFINQALKLLGPIADQIQFFDSASYECWNVLAREEAI